MKRFVVAFLAVYIFIFFWGWLLNGMLLKDIYEKTSTLWRSQREMMSLFHWIIIGKALVVFDFVSISACCFVGGGVMVTTRQCLLVEIVWSGIQLGCAVFTLL